MVIQRDRPSVRPFLHDASTHAREIRDQFVMGSWFRAFIAPDFSRGVIVEAVEFRTRSAAKALLRPKGRADNRPPSLPPGAEARVLEASDTQFIRTTVLYIGRVSVHVEVYASGPDGERSSAALLSQVAFAQEARIGERPDVGSRTFSVRRMAIGLLAAEIWVLIVTQAGIGMLTLMRDRSARQRLRHRVMGAPSSPVPYVVDVDKEAVARLRRHARRAVLRNAVAIGVLLASSLLLHLNLWQTAVALMGALLVWSQIERRLGLSSSLPPAGLPRFRGWTAVLGGALVAIGAALLALGLLLLWMLAVGQAIGTPGADAETATTFRRLVFTAAVVTLLLSQVPVMLARRVAIRQLAADLRRDSRPKTLLLRSFVDDRIRMPLPRGPGVLVPRTTGAPPVRALRGTHRPHTLRTRSRHGPR
ncbi:MAG TPA: hypothetical protein VK988_02220 [Acidimicrobiales bacterium]|nr:hypothetical protein [Acidimicrobiales bacterium]